ncbi:MAG: hypothetical protein CFE45_03305 [Burkholderiales bacterium PBB5]|nr:MAG: hypothetical protein CFE45_03305 [Burkholderiales bacterium PBB5]
MPRNRGRLGQFFGFLVALSLSRCGLCREGPVGTIGATDPIEGLVSVMHDRAMEVAEIALAFVIVQLRLALVSRYLGRSRGRRKSGAVLSQLRLDLQATVTNRAARLQSDALLLSLHAVIVGST